MNSLSPPLTPLLCPPRNERNGNMFKVGYSVKQGQSGPDSPQSSLQLIQSPLMSRINRKGGQVERGKGSSGKLRQSPGRVSLLDIASSGPHLPLLAEVREAETCSELLLWTKGTSGGDCI